MTPLPNRLFGVFVAAGCIVAIFVVRTLVRRDDRLVGERTLLPGLAFVMLAAALAAARVGVILLEPDFLMRPWLLVWPFDEQMRFVGLRGMNFHTGLLAGLVAGYVYLRAHAGEVRRWINAVSLGLVFAYIVTSAGSFLTADALGRITTAPWAPVIEGAPGVPVTFPPAERIAAALGLPATDPGVLVNLPRHPYQLYKAVVLLALLVIPARHVARGIGPGKPGGRVSAYVLVGLGITRALAGFLAVPARGGILLVEEAFASAAPHWLPANAAVLSLDQLLSVAIALAGLVLFLVHRHADLRRPRVEFLDPGLGLD